MLVFFVNNSIYTKSLAKINFYRRGEIDETLKLPTTKENAFFINNNDGYIYLMGNINRETGLAEKIEIVVYENEISKPVEIITAQSGKYDKENKKLFDTYIGFYTKFFTKNDKQIKLKNNISLMKDLGVTVCPYCNRNYINSRHDKLGCEFDHYYSKDKFPFFALTLSNLVPSCSTCNRIKQANDYEFCPFDLERREKVKFIVSPPSQNSKIGIYFDGISQKDNLLQLESAYEIHKIDVDEMFMKEEKYCKEYRDYLISLLGDKGNIGNEFSEEFFDSMIFGEIANDSFDDYLNHSLSKLKKDTYDYIVELREK